MIPARVDSIEELLSAWESRVRRLADAARRRISTVVPHATERLRPGWGLIGYNAPAYFAFIAPARDHVRIGFEWGVMLADPQRVLEGYGSQVRHVTIRTVRDLRSPALAELIRAAASIRPPPRTRRRRPPGPAGRAPAAYASRARSDPAARPWADLRLHIADSTPAAPPPPTAFAPSRH